MYDVTLRLNEDELLLLDWVLCYPTQQTSIALEDYMNWRQFRLDVWHVLSRFARARKRNETLPDQEFGIDESNAAVLLAMVPTTHVWGSGSDCGYSLKLKLSRAMLGEVEDANHSAGQTQSGPEDEP